MWKSKKIVMARGSMRMEFRMQKKCANLICTNWLEVTNLYTTFNKLYILFSEHNNSIFTYQHVIQKSTPVNCFQQQLRIRLLREMSPLSWILLFCTSILKEYWKHMSSYNCVQAVEVQAMNNENRLDGGQEMFIHWVGDGSADIFGNYRSVFHNRALVTVAFSLVLILQLQQMPYWVITCIMT
jgi:hypothetical protein